MHNTPKNLGSNPAHRPTILNTSSSATRTNTTTATPPPTTTTKTKTIMRDMYEARRNIHATKRFAAAASGKPIGN